VRELEGERVCVGEENGGENGVAGCCLGRLQGRRRERNFRVENKEKERVLLNENFLFIPPIYTSFLSMISCQVPP